MANEKLTKTIAEIKELAEISVPIYTESRFANLASMHILVIIDELEYIKEEHKKSVLIWNEEVKDLKAELETANKEIAELTKIRDGMLKEMKEFEKAKKQIVKLKKEAEFGVRQ